jgi:branched-chain amino acid transport system substrate-binding protein
MTHRRGASGKSALVAAMLLSVGVAACGDDDDGAEESGPSVTSSVSGVDTVAATTEPPGASDTTSSKPGVTDTQETTSTDAPATGPQSAPANSETLEVVTVASLTGPNQGNSIPLARGVELAADEINAAGGIVAGDTAYMLEVTTEDSGGDPNQAVAITREAVADGVPVVVASSTSAETIPMSELIVPSPETLMLSPSSALLADLRAADPGAFPNVISNQVVASTFRECYIPTYLELSGAETVGIVMTDNVTGQSIAESLPELIEAAGGEVVASELYAPETTDFAPILTEVRNADPDLILVGYIPVQVASLLRQANDLGITNIAGVEGVYPNAVEEAVGERIEGFMWLHNLPPLPAEGKLAEVWDAWQAKYGDDPAGSPDSNALVYLGYDAVIGFQEAVERAGSVEPAAVVEAFADLEYTGILDWTYDENASASVEIVIGRWEDGEPVYHECVQ